MAESVVVLGGGVGGTIVANRLSRRLKGRVHVRVIDRKGRHFYEPSLIFAMIGKAETDRLWREERRLLRKDIDLVVGDAVRVDTERRLVHMGGGDAYRYDYLVLSPGARLVPEAVPGYVGNAHHFYTGPAAMELRQQIRSFEGGDVLIGPSTLPYKCPPAPLEATFLLDEYFKKHRTKKPVRFRYLSPIGRAFTIESVSPVVERLLEERGIELTTFFNLENIDGQRRVVQSLEGEEIPYDLLVLAPPHRGAKIAEDSGLAGPGGWIPTDRETLRVKGQEDMWAIGDCTDLPLSKAGSTAHFEAPVVADAIQADVLGTGRAPKYDGHVMCFFETGGGKGMILDFNYDHPPSVKQPTRRHHWAKIAFNKMYWATIPTARL